MKKHKGISLIVLIITIIVIVILAGAMILSLSENNPISNANQAIFKSNVATYNSELSVAIANQYLQDSSFNPTSFNASVWDGVADAKTIKKYITSITPQDGLKFEIQNGKLVYVGDIQKEKDYITGIGLSNKIELGINVIATQNSTVNGKLSSYSNPIVPKGFKAVNDVAIWPNDWNVGLVIEDVNGNQFVWVPVDGTNVTYAKWCTSGISFEDATNDTLPEGIISETDQIAKYDGFYIARYEAGKENVDTLVSKKYSTVWGDINYTDSKIKSESMYNTSELKSGLLTGTQWDTTMKWLVNSGKNVINSTTLGNYSNSQVPANVAGFASLQVSGYSEFWKTNNIYDMAGNTWEWTNEKNYSYCIYRGGSAYNSGSDYPVASRANNDSSVTYGDISFRVALYIL